MRARTKHISNISNQPPVGLADEPRAKARKWTPEELEIIQRAINRLNQGYSIYSQVKWMRLGTILSPRTYDSIRQKLTEMKRKRGAR